MLPGEEESWFAVGLFIFRLHHQIMHPEDKVDVYAGSILACRKNAAFRRGNGTPRSRGSRFGTLPGWMQCWRFDPSDSPLAGAFRSVVKS
jgi:hypothetical protein